MQFMDTPPLPDPFKAAIQDHVLKVSQQESRLDQLKTALKEKGILLDYEYEAMMGTEFKIWRATKKKYEPHLQLRAFPKITSRVVGIPFP